MDGFAGWVCSSAHSHIHMYSVCRWLVNAVNRPWPSNKLGRALLNPTCVLTLIIYWYLYIWADLAPETQSFVLKSYLLSVRTRSDKWGNTDTLGQAKWIPLFSSAARSFRNYAAWTSLSCFLPRHTPWHTPWHTGPIVRSRVDDRLFALQWPSFCNE